MALALALILPFVTLPAQAQLADPSVSVRADAPSLALGPDEPGSARWTVRNTGPVELQMRLTLQPPSGWQASFVPGSQAFSLAAGAQRQVEATIRSVSLSGDGQQDAALPADGELGLTAQGTDALGRSVTASAATSLSYVAPTLPPPTHDQTWETWVAGVASLALLAAIALGLHVRAARQVVVHASARQRPITTGTDGIFVVEVENRSRRTRDVQLRVDGLPASWYGAFSFPRVALRPGERSPVPLCIKVPPDATHGEVAFVLLSARPTGRHPWLSRTVTRIEAHDHLRVRRAPADTA